jgi:hypothetical protein
MIKYAFSNMLVHFLRNYNCSASSALYKVILTGGIIGIDTPHKQIINICTTGLGNRIMSLITALYWSDVLKASPVKMLWFANSECNLDSSDIFNTDPHTIKFVDKDILIGCTNHLSSEILNIKDERNITTLCNYNTTLINNWIIPEYITTIQQLKYIKHLRFKNDIVNTALNFINNNNIDANTTGLMLRGTDGIYHGIQSSIQKCYSYVQNQKSDRFFIMSDEDSIIKKFYELENVITYPTRSFVKFNKESMALYRDKQSVIDGIINLLILSRTNILNTTNSSFLKVAKLYSQIKL